MKITIRNGKSEKKVKVKDLNPGTLFNFREEPYLRVDPSNGKDIGMIMMNMKTFQLDGWGGSYDGTIKESDILGVMVCEQ
jgi:hypothetical protein